MVLVLALTRLEAETAVLSPYLGWIDPQSILTTVGGTTSFGAMDKVHLGMLSWFNSDYRAASLPHQLAGLCRAESGPGEACAACRWR